MEKLPDEVKKIILGQLRAIQKNLEVDWDMQCDDDVGDAFELLIYEFEKMEVDE